MPKMITGITVNRMTQSALVSFLNIAPKIGLFPTKQNHLSAL
jgi:hypothetical protein